MDQAPPAGHGAPGDGPSSTGSVFPNPIPRLLEPTQFSGETSMRETPDMSADIDNLLRLKTPPSSTDPDEDSLESDTSSEADDIAIVPRGLPISKLPTGLCYDERMRYHAEVAATTGEYVHPEDPRRIYYIYKELCEAGLVDDKRNPPIVEVPLKRIDAREVTLDEVLLVHTQDQYDFVKETSSYSDELLIDMSEQFERDSIYYNQLSFFSGKLSAGGAIETCRAVLSRKVKNAIAVIRPPGHHAEIEKSMGFCLFNNVGIASRVCQQDFGDDCRKILILDWDVHHGNGCQQVFYEDPNVLYISLHVHMNGTFYPATNEGDMYHCGVGPGEGKNVNIPWPTKGMGDGDYMYAFQSVVMPIAVEFDPDFVIVAAGFDAAAGDELGGCFVSPPCYAHMTHMLMSLAGGKIAVCLEGGYNFGAISKSALAVTRTLMGEPPDRLLPTAATPAAIETVAKVRNVQSKYWRSIFPKDPVAGIFGGERLHDIIREWQAMHLYDKYKLTQLHIFRDSISKSFNQQVLASPNYESKKSLLVICHDAPDLLGSPNALSTQQKAHDTWLVDGTQSYVRWAISQGMGVIDINIPEHITVKATDAAETLYGNNATSSQVEYSSTTTDAARKEGEKLAAYLWENYIEPYDFPGGIIMMGAGHAFHAVARLVSENEAVYPLLLGIVCFISTQPIRPISSVSSHWVSQWYRDNSLVFVAGMHSVWKKEGRVSKRYGKVVRSEGTLLNQMMKLHEEDACRWMGEKIRIHREENMETSEDEGEEDNGAVMRDSDGDTIDDPAASAAAATESSIQANVSMASAAGPSGDATASSSSAATGPEAAARPMRSMALSDVLMSTDP